MQWSADILGPLPMSESGNSFSVRSSVPGTSDLCEGDSVMLKVQIVPRGKTRKLSFRFEGPYRVLEVRRPDYVILRNRRRKLVHGSNLKKVSGVSTDVPSCDFPSEVSGSSTPECDVTGPESPVSVVPLVVPPVVPPVVPSVVPYRTQSGRLVKPVERLQYVM